MSNLLVDFATFFTAANIATSAYGYDMMPDSPDSAVAIHEYQGHGSLPQIGSSSRAIQFVARDAGAEQSKRIADALYRALGSEDGIVTLTAERWVMIGLSQLPFKLKVDERSRTYYAFNAVVTTFQDN